MFYFYWDVEFKWQGRKIIPVCLTFVYGCILYSSLHPNRYSLGCFRDLVSVA
jgi:hypothetical protein